MEYVRVEHFCTFCYGESTLKEILKSNKELKFFNKCILYIYLLTHTVNNSTVLKTTSILVNEAKWFQTS